MIRRWQRLEQGFWFEQRCWASFAATRQDATWQADELVLL